MFVPAGLFSIITKYKLVDTNVVMIAAVCLNDIVQFNTRCRPLRACYCGYRDRCQHRGNYRKRQSEPVVQRHFWHLPSEKIGSMPHDITQAAK